MQAIPFISLSDDKFIVNKQAKDFLQTLNNPLKIVTIVGKYRTGKSLFLNKVLLEYGGFKVSPTINSCTKGLWLWRNDISLNQKQHMLVIDTQGFGDIQESDNYCNKILLFALLLSSYFIYNSVGSIDENSLNNINVIANMAKEIQNKNNSNDKIEQYFPSFLWIVRDFTLNLVDRSGCTIDSKQYLQQALQLQKGSSNNIENKNKIRRMIKHYFQDRYCFTMIRPVETQQQLQKLDILKEQQFRPEFIKQVKYIRQHIMSKIKIKKIKNKFINGTILINLAQSYAEIINNGSIPNFEITWKNIMQIQRQKIINEILNNVYLQFEKYKDQCLSEIKIEIIHNKIFIMMRTIIKQNNLQEELILNKIHQLMQQFKSNNRKKCRNMFIDVFSDQKSMVKDSINLQNLLEQCQGAMENIAIRMKDISMIEMNQQNERQCLKWKIEQIILQCKKQQKQNQRLNKELEQQNQKSKIQKQSNEILNNKIQQIQAQLELKLKQIQQKQKLWYLKQKEYKNKQIKYKQQIIQLKENKKQYQNENKILKNNIIIIQNQKQKYQKNNQILKENKFYLLKEVEILKCTIQSKVAKINDQQHKLNIIQNHIKIIQEQKYYLNSKYSQENQNQKLIMDQLKNNNQSVKKQLLQKIKSNIKLETELENKNIIMKQQRIIYQGMFDKLKDSFKEQNNTNKQLIQTNKNLSLSLNLMQKRSQQYEQKQKELKNYKKCIKNSLCLQCKYCTKFFISSVFIPHLKICIISNNHTINQIQSIYLEQEKENCLKISIKQTLVKQLNGKPFTQYIIEFRRGEQEWTINRRYKQFCDLNNALRNALPGVQISSVAYIVNPHEGSKKSLLIQERRKNLQKYLEDISINPLARNCKCWKQFIQQPNLINNKASIIDLSLKENIVNNQYRKPEEFFKIWQSRNQRFKQSQFIQSNS